MLFWWLLVWVLFPPQPLLFCPPAFCSAARSQRDEGTLSPSLFADGLSPGCRELLRPEPGPGLPLPPLSSGRRGLPAGARCSLGLPFPAGALGGAGGESGAGLTAGAGPALAAACRPRQRGCLCVGPAPWAVAGAAGASSPVEGHGGSGPTTGGGGGEAASLPGRTRVPYRRSPGGPGRRGRPHARSPGAAARPSPWTRRPRRLLSPDYNSQRAPRRRTTAPGRLRAGLAFPPSSTPSRRGAPPAPSPASPRWRMRGGGGARAGHARRRLCSDRGGAEGRGGGGRHLGRWAVSGGGQRQVRCPGLSFLSPAGFAARFPSWGSFLWRGSLRRPRPGGGRAAVGGGSLGARRGRGSAGLPRGAQRGPDRLGEGGAGALLLGEVPRRLPLRRVAGMPSGAGLPLAEPCGREAGLPREGFFSAPC